MEELLRALADYLNHTRELLIVSLIFARTVPMVVLTPFLGGKLVPTEVKMGLAVLVTILVWPLARTAIKTEIPVNLIEFVPLMLKEAFIGFVLGFVNAHVFFALDMAGRLIDTVRGTSMSEVQDPHSKQRVTPVGDLYTQLFLIIFVVSGAYRIFFKAYFYSFETMPLDQFLPMSGPGAFEFIDFMMKLVAQLLIIAVILAAPIVAATFISDIVFGILNRVAPQLNAYFMSMPVKALGGVIMIFIALEAIVTRMGDFVVWTLKALEDTMLLLFT